MLAKRLSLIATALLPERYVPEDQDLPAHVEVELVCKTEEFHKYVGVLGVGADGVFLRAVVQDELERELARRPALLLAPIRVHVGDLANHDALLGVAFSHYIPPVVLWG